MVNIFISYAPEDLDFQQDIIKQFKPAIRTGELKAFAHTDVPGGWDAEMRASRIILLLLSQDFINSDACYEHQTLALQLAAQGQHRVIPIILKACVWKDTELSKLNALPSPGGNYPVTDAKWNSEDEAFLNIAKAIREDAIKWAKTLPELVITGGGSTPAPNNHATPVQPKPSGGVKRILFLGANPTDGSRLRIDAEMRGIEAQLRSSIYRDKFEFMPKFAVRVEDIQGHFLDTNPNIVHFSGHGTGEAGLAFENQFGRSQLVETGPLANLFRLFSSTVDCVLLNACYAEAQAKAIVQHIPYVIGMNDAIPDNAALAFSSAFYDALGAGRDYEMAFELGKNAIALQGITGELIPVLLKKA